MPYRYGSGWREIASEEESIIFLKKKTAIKDPLTARQGGLLHITIPLSVWKGGLLCERMFFKCTICKSVAGRKGEAPAGKIIENEIRL